MTAPRSWLERYPEGRLKAWHLSWRETEERVRELLERGPLGSRAPREREAAA